MNDQLGVIVTGVGVAVSGIISALALYRRAGNEASRPRTLLQRLWDWVEGAGLDTEVPVTLANDVRRELSAPPGEEAAPGDEAV